MLQSLGTVCYSYWRQLKEISCTQSNLLATTIKQLALRTLKNVVPTIFFFYFHPGPSCYGIALGFIFYKQMKLVINDLENIFDPIDHQNPQASIVLRGIIKTFYTAMAFGLYILGLPHSKIIMSIFFGARLGASINPNYGRTIFHPL